MYRPAWYGFAIVLTAALAGHGPAAAAPTRLDLGGKWQSIGMDAPGFPAADVPGWTDVDVIRPVPARPWVCQRRQFEVPSAWVGQRLFLRFEGVKYTAQVRCNGTPVGEHRGGYEPFECEITQVARGDGPNTVEVLAGSWQQLTADPAKVAEGGLGRDDIDEARDQILYPIGSHQSMGIWAPVSLVSRPNVYIEDVRIVTSVRRHAMTVATTVRNLSPAATPVSVSAAVRRADRMLLTVAPAVGTLAPGATATLAQSCPWSDPPLWWPHDPVLLDLDVELRTAEAVLDRRTERFGFREVWTDGPRFVLNGTPLHLLGNSCHPLGYTRAEAETTYRLCREANINCFRLHAQPWGKAWYDVADETGMLIIHETAVWCFSRGYALGDARFWENTAEHIRAQIRLHRNRPSIIGWSLENEILHCGGDRVKETEQRLADLAVVARQEDSSRLISYDGDEDRKAGCARNPRGQRSEVRGQTKPLHMIAACDHLGCVRL